MDLEYDRKFEEMKKYIPFLESMISRLENTSTATSNPRQAQLDKIRSLRDLLLDKKKRMKMDNLLKCEQVLINLYAKVEQRDTLPGIQPASEVIPSKDKADLNLARNKLKTVTSKTHDPDTLPEIARATETEVVCTPGSKEPALFQRRPNKGSLSPVKSSSKDKSPHKSSTKRNYTRVLLSPDRSKRIWSPSDGPPGPPGDENLFSRRSPPRPPRRYSPSYHKRERKKSSRQEAHVRKSKDLNITLKVPEERLNSLNTKDILSRIINCSDGDVDIDTLRELRTQILGELKHTGANEDISDLILKSYKNKKNKKSQSKNKTDVEEGELSDSESEAIENIYGNLVVLEKDKSKDVTSNRNKQSTEQEQVSRKIQISLVINSDKEETSLEASKNKNTTDNQNICDITDFEMFDDNSSGKNPKPAYSGNNEEVVDKEPASQKTNTSLSPVKTKTNCSDIITIEDIESEKDQNVKYGSEVIDMHNFNLQDNSNSTILNEIPTTVPEPVPIPFKGNFYKPTEYDSIESIDSLNKEDTPQIILDQSVEKQSDPMDPNQAEVDVRPVSKDKNLDSTGKSCETTRTENVVLTTNITPDLSSKSSANEDPEIPLLNEPTVQPAKKDIVSEIDILQALKNEILSDTISIPGAETATPALHQPKVTKVSNAQELPKKRISIENYKRKTVPSSKPSLFVNNTSKKESMKQSLKLTDKEVERFNLISKIALDDDSDDERDTELKSPEMDLAPKSPDMDISDNTPVSPPVIIPADPVKMVVASSKTDIDMRKLPTMSPNTTSPFAPSTPIQTKNDVHSEFKNFVDKPELKRQVLPVDPRIRKEALLPTPPIYPNMTPSRIPSAAPNMTPSRTPNMTPNARTFDFNPNRPFNSDDNARKHVYAPMFPVQDNPVDRKSGWEPSEQSPIETSNWEMSNADREKTTVRKWEDRNRSSYSQRDDGPRSRYNDSNYDTSYNRSRIDRNSRDEYHRQEIPQANYYSRADCPATPTPSFGRGDAPSTPSHYFGRSECPRTPSHPFGRPEPSNQSFGMSEPPLTPSHPFGRSEAPLTPSHSFGRSEGPMTPSHPFGRSEAPATPSHPFGRSDYSYTNPSPKFGKAQDPRLNRSYDHDSNSRRDTGSYNDRHRYYRNDPRNDPRSDPRSDPRNFNREQSVSRNDTKPYTPDQTYRRDQMSRREPSVGRSIPNGSDRDRLYCKDRDHGSDNSRSYAEVGSRRSFQREPSANRSVPDYRARASSVGRSVKNNELSVESHAGRAFTIDTSVNSTFQKFLESHKIDDISFDARRQRASSVGRSLTRESSVGRNLPSIKPQKIEENNRDRFKRAQSVGRDVTTYKTEKSFKDVKAEFESYRNNYRKLNNDYNNSQLTRTKQNTNSRDPRVRRESYDIQQDTKYSSNKTQVRESHVDVKRFNYRDPRQRKEQKFKEKYNYQHDRKRADSHDKHSYGISSDGVTKNATVNSVKNYKIPKIKRPEPEEKPVESISETSSNKTEKKKTSASSAAKDSKLKSTTCQVKLDKKIKVETKKSDKILSTKADDDLPEKSDKRVTRRSGKKNEETSVPSEEDEIIQTRTRKFKKVIYDSDSDEDVTQTKSATKSVCKIKTKGQTASPKKISSRNKNIVIQSEKNEENGDTNTTIKSVQESPIKNMGPDDNQDSLDCSFGLDDDINLFPDNIITDPVLDNINALIADLDNDLDSSKTGTPCNDLFNDISIEHMLEKITSSPIKHEAKKPIIDANTVKKDFFDNTKNTPEKILEKVTTSPLKSENQNTFMNSVSASATHTIKEDLFDKLKNETNINTTVPVTSKVEYNNPLFVAEDKSAENSNKSYDQKADINAKQIDPPQTRVIYQTHEKNDLEPVVSTSANEEESCKKDQSIDSEKNADGRSTPDSTNDAESMNKNVSETVGDKPDSTIEKQCEMNSDISSTHDADDKAVKENIEGSKDALQEQTSHIESIGSLLSILQDKSKIKQLLSMLGDQSSENEKIKKKLEKLSEIVSDDEDTNDKFENDSKRNEFSNDKSVNETEKQDNQKELHHETEAVKPEETGSNTFTNNEQNVDTKNEHKVKSTASSKTIAETDNDLGNSQPHAQVQNEDKDKWISSTIENAETSVAKETTNSTEVNKDEQEQEDDANDADNDYNSEPEDYNEEESVKEPDTPKPRKKIMKKILKRIKTGKFKKGKVAAKKVVGEEKRVTRSEAAGLLTKPKPKKTSRELRLLQESIKEMFMSDAILNASGIRMCRLAKMVDEKTQKSEAPVAAQEPIVVLEKVKHVEENEVALEKPIRKKPGPKPKIRPVSSHDDKNNKEDDKPLSLIKYKPGPKSKTKILQGEKDPYNFETDSINESKTSEQALDSGSDSESDSMASSKSFGSTELLVELKKKPKRKRGGWKAGVIKPKNKKRKVEAKRAQSPPPKPTPELKRTITIPDPDCFTDKNYCFSKDAVEYPCRLCESTHKWQDIVFHYKKHHPHSEIPLSRMSPEIAREAIEQCGDVDFAVVSKMPTDKYTCRFCFKEFGKRRAVLETFFWHVVSMHTGEYKQLCSECINVERCPFHLDIPPPPKDVKGQLIGYICGKCNFTQISLENLKMHVIDRHNDTETEVYTINFAVMTKNVIASLIRRCNLVKPRTTRSTRSNQSLAEASDDKSDITESEQDAQSEKKSDTEVTEKRKFSFKSKITFENDDNASDISNFANTDSSLVKLEQDVDEDNNQQDNMDETFREDAGGDQEETGSISQASDKSRPASDDIMDYPHFKINYTDAGNKEYICCINGKDNHYKTGLLISLKKHVQLKHSEIWDGYCFVCKVIVTSQGQHKFSECLTHFLDSHIDNFPVLEKVSELVEKRVTPAGTPEPTERAPAPYINVRPLSQLVEPIEPPVDTPAMPVIDSVISLVPPTLPTVEPPRPSPTYPVTKKETEPPKEYKYEEAQAEIMSKKHQVVFTAMMSPDKLVQVFKCAGRFCSFTTDSAEDALLHASTHQRVGGTNALLCAYCDFDSSGNSIDLVSHVFKSHGRCRVVCGLCFYRAAASQLVAAHITRMHGETPDRRCVLKSNNVSAVCEPTEENLSRENAVPHYICKQSENDELCSFRTVTHTKFWEHLMQKHANATLFNCYICSASCPGATELVLHLKTHGLKLYHCTLCVFGADNEPELLAHASQKHPAKTPQAYIRTICGTTGNGSFKILPLVELKKAALEPEEITPKQAKENPVREAERSIELEKLIGHMLDTPAPEEPPEESVTPISEVLPEIIVNDAISNLLDDPAAMATLIPVPPIVSPTVQTPPRPVTPAPTEANISKELTPVLKEEPMDNTPEKNDSDVICLDSDDEDSKQGIINLSDEEKAASEQNPTSFSGVFATNKIKDIFKCGKCKKTAKSNAGFKKHTYACYKFGEKYKCAHCRFETDKDAIYFKHYLDAHYTPACLKCPICPHTDSTMYLLKRHIKITHEPSPFPSDKEYVLGKQNTGAKAKPVKRKSSGPAAGGTPAKQKRYGPLDIDKLPINPILDESVFCDICEFSTKVRLNMVRHLQLHAEQQPVPQTAPVNPVPHLETNEKHFDKMVNLASSSIAMRAEKPVKEPTPSVTIPSDKISRLPRYVPERYRYTCGASGCTYISVDEGMLKCHWETLHAGTYDYHCVHCPPHQFLDKSRPLTASRIIAHLKMHDIQLYACSACPYYHHRRQLLDKHIVEAHRGDGTVLVVREANNQPTPTTPIAAPTMDLKPWQCGLCKFKSMLRPDVIEHCAKLHQSKMQYKCAYCPFRTSMPENVTKHQTTSHPNRVHEIFYFYYREGSIPHGTDGTPHWQKQRQKTGLDHVKDEADPPPVTTGTILPQIQPQPVSAVNLNLVKQEIDPDIHAVQDSLENLCKKYGDFCEPNGLNYKCSLCKVVVEDSKEAMQSHLFEELQYRKWGCRVCAYKAFHQTGLKEHMWTEHKKNQEPIELAVDVNVESWVSKQLDYQEDLIKKNREKLAQQKMQDERPVAPTTSKTVEVQNSATKVSQEKLEKIFGSLGAPSNMQFCCPKCLFKTGDEKIIQQHLEAELTRIRWCCSSCPNHFSTYHEAQFHCKSVHSGRQPAARPVEAARDPTVRSAWVSAVLRGQRLAMSAMPTAVAEPSPPEENTESNDDDENNSLLVIRYEEDVPTPEEETLRRQRRNSDSDDESLVIDEQALKKAGPAATKCDYCDFTTKYPHVLDTHVLRHYNLKPFTCPYGCDFTGYRINIIQHVNTNHPNQPMVAKKTEKPSGPPLILNFLKTGKKITPVKKVPEDPLVLVCLTCDKLLSEPESKSHLHEFAPQTFAKRGDIVVKCSECLMLFLDVVDMQKHFTNTHPDLPINYAYYKTDHDSRGFIFCSHCNQRFSYLVDLKSHHNFVHSSLKLKYTSKPYSPGAGAETSGEPPSKKKADENS